MKVVFTEADIRQIIKACDLEFYMGTATARRKVIAGLREIGVDVEDG